MVQANANAKPAAGKAQKKGKNKDDDSVYKSTVRLPQTSFGARLAIPFVQLDAAEDYPERPTDLRANSKTREPELQKWWKEKRIYERCDRGACFVS